MGGVSDRAPPEREGPRLRELHREAARNGRRGDVALATRRRTPSEGQVECKEDARTAISLLERNPAEWFGDFRRSPRPRRDAAAKTQPGRGEALARSRGVGAVAD